MKQIQFGLFFTCLFIALNIKAQQHHFIYIQADNKQPFYVKVDKKIYSSTVAGYLILTKLKTGVYNFVIGFPKNEWPEQNINCTVEDKDLGYLLKNFGDKGWGFFNLQSLNVLMAENNEKKADVATDLKSDAFSNMLSLVVNDPTIKQNEPVKEPLKKVVKEIINVEPPVVTPIVQDKVVEKSEASSAVVTVDEKVKPDTSVKNSTQIVSSPDVKVVENLTATSPIIVTPDKKEVAELVIINPTINSPTIFKKSTNKTDEGVEMVYIDMANAMQDTVKIFVDIDKDIVDNKQIMPATEVKSKEEVIVKETTPVSVKAGEKIRDNKFLEIELLNPNKNINQVIVDSAAKQEIVRTPMINSDCKDFATNDDFLKLRKKMAAKDKPDDMINIAKKTFKSKCFSTDQVKNLSVLFLKDSIKYNFFDTAYPYVSDTQNYSILESQLTDNYYINRFKVMIKH